MGVVVGVAVVVVLAFLASGFGAINPVGFTFNLVNNTGHVVKLEDCGNPSPPCVLAPYSEITTVDQRQSESDAVNPDGVLEPWEVFGRSGSSLGCLPFRYTSAPARTIVIDITQMVPCDHSLGSETTRGHDWPFRKY